MRVSRTKRQAGRERPPGLPIGGPSPLGHGSQKQFRKNWGVERGMGRERPSQTWPRQGKVKPSKEAADLRFLAGCCFTNY